MFVWIVAGLLLPTGCAKKSGAHPGGSNNAGTPAASAKLDLAAAGNSAFSPDGKPKDAAKGGNKDYWKGVRFDVHNFEEVVDYVTTYYIEEKPNTQRAWVTAANNALSILTTRHELVPTSFLVARREHADEEGRLDGDTGTFSCDGKIVAGISNHKIPSLKYLKSKRKKRSDRRLTDDEIRALRAKDKTRYRLYRKSWKSLVFGRKQFRCAMTLVAAELKKEAKSKAENKKPVATANGGVTATKANGEADTAKAGHVRTDATAEKTKKTENKAKTNKTTKTVKAAKTTKTVKAAKTAAEAKKDTAPVPLYAPDDPPKAGEKAKAVRRFKPDMNRAWLAASRAYLYALDPHSSVISRRAWDESTRKTENSSFEGIGAVLTQRGERTIVENPMEQLPAWKAGVRAGDEIQAVDGVDVRGWLLNKVVDAIRGPKSTKVVLRVQREGEPKPLDIGIMRAHIPIKNVTGKLIKEYPGIGYVKMTGFIPSSTRHLRDKIAELKRQHGKPLKGLVLDLRRNSGGLLNRAIEVADMFLDHGVVVSVKSRRVRPGGRPEEVHRARREPSDLKMPLIVLVNDGSASASEIVASAIQENGRGLVVGLRTFGKASVQTLFEPALHLDYYIKLTVARYYAPSGRTIQVLGVKPDIQLAPKVDGKIPLGYREENLTNHLDPIQTAHVSPLAPMLPALHACVKRAGRADKIVKKDPRPQIQPDYQLMRASDYLLCLARLQNGR
jgi:C-terminal peptidase prc